MAAALSERQSRFIEAYLVSGNASAAARTAGYSAKSAGFTGYKLLKQRGVSAALAERKQVLEDKAADISIDRILAECAAVAYGDAQIKGSDKLKALELLGKYRKIWLDNTKADSGPKIQVNIGFLSPVGPEIKAITATVLQDE